jgi:putative FmdB family regulatory protein
MPLYEYQCGDCGRRFELIQKFSDPPVEQCPTCGGSVQKLVSSPAIQFRGAGWYVTDYARKGQPAEGAESSGDRASKPPADGDGASTAPGGAEAKSSPASTPATSSPASESSGSASKTS